MTIESLITAARVRNSYTPKHEPAHDGSGLYDPMEKPWLAEGHPFMIGPSDWPTDQWKQFQLLIWQTATDSKKNGF